MADTFPRQHARTQRLTLGEPRNFTVSPDGSTVLFARSAHGSDPFNVLWAIDVATGNERVVFDPRDIGGDDSQLTVEELRRRERAREGAGGVVSYSTDATCTTAVTVLSGQPYVVNIAEGTARALPVDGGVFDARLNPQGTSIAYCRNAALCVSNLAGDEHVVVAPESPTVTWGLAEFIAAEEMGRMRGYWWSPEGTHLVVARVDNASVTSTHIADPAHPEVPAVEHRYPFAGGTNATVSLHIFSAEFGAPRVDVNLPGEWEYLTSVSWTEAGLIAQVQTRDQKRIDVFSIDTSTGDCAPIFTDTDECWVELVPGVPTLNSSGALVTCADRDGVRRLLVSGAPVTPTTLQVRSVISVGSRIVFAANPIDSPRRMNLWSVNDDGSELTCIIDGPVVAGAVVNSDASTYVARIASMSTPRATFTINGKVAITSHAEEALVQPNVSFHTVGKHDNQVAILLPRDGKTTKLPVLFDPYGGPHAQRVVDSYNAFATSQWFADQGFCVVVADNRGTPGRGSAYERCIHNDIASLVLEDQVEVARAIASLEPRADVSRVAIRGWSFGGYLAALTVMRAPEVFHCAVAGAPVTDWRLYDTHYTERYCGNPTVDDSAYESTSLLTDADKLSRPLLLVHGLADDNVFAAHSLQLSTALLAAGKPHELLALSGVSHMTPQEVVAENLLLHQLAFIKRSLRID